MNQPRILFYDLETTHNVVASFRLWGEDYIPHQNLIQERYIVTVSWKWAGETKVHSLATTDFPKVYKKNPHDDSAVVKAFHTVLQEANVIVAHNGDQYDAKFFAGRAIKHGLPPLPPVVSIDTKKVAKNKFLFNSNRLDYLGNYLGVGRKIETTPGLWMKILVGTDAERRAAIKEMVVYNKQDVLLLEDVFNKLKPFIPNHYNRHIYTGEQALACPYCGSKHFQSRGTHPAKTRIYKRYQCQAQGCMRWFGDAKALPGKPVVKTLD